MDVCEKIYKSVFCIQDKPANANPSAKNSPAASDHAEKSHDSHNHKNGHGIHINFDYSTLPAQSNGNGNGNIQKNGLAPRVVPEMEHVLAAAGSKTNPRTDVTAPGRTQQSKIKPEVTEHDKEGGKKTGIHIEDRFTDYITRAKAKIRTMSIKDGNYERGKDRFSEYIDRAKVKLRTTSSIGGGGGGGRHSFK